MTDVTIPDSIPGDPTVHGEANQIIWDASSIYTYYNGTWGRSPRTVDHWNDLEGDVRFVLCNKEQLLTQEQKQIACKNLGILPATTERFGIVRYTDNWQDTGSGDPGFWPVTLTRTAIIELCKHQFEEYVYTMDVGIYEKCAEVYDFTVQAADLACTAADAAEGFASDAMECVINAPDITANNTFTASNTFNGPAVLNGPVAGQGIDDYSDEYCMINDVWVGVKPTNEELDHADIFGMQVAAVSPTPYALAHGLTNIPPGMRIKKLLIPVYKGDKPSDIRSRHGFVVTKPPFSSDPYTVPESAFAFLSDVETSYYDDDYDEHGLKWVECPCKDPKGYIEYMPIAAKNSTLTSLENNAYCYTPDIKSAETNLLYHRGAGQPDKYYVHSVNGSHDRYVQSGSCMAQFTGLQLSGSKFCLYTCSMYPGLPVYIAPILLFGDIPSKSIAAGGFDIALRHQREEDRHVANYERTKWNKASELADELDTRLGAIENIEIEEINTGHVLSAVCASSPSPLTYPTIKIYVQNKKESEATQVAYYNASSVFGNLNTMVDTLNAADTMAGFISSIVDGQLVITSDTYYNTSAYRVYVELSTIPGVFDPEMRTISYEFDSDATVLHNMHSYKHTAVGSNNELIDVRVDDNASALMYVTFPNNVSSLDVSTDWMEVFTNIELSEMEGNVGVIKPIYGPGTYAIQVQSIKDVFGHSKVVFTYKQYIRSEHSNPILIETPVSNTLDEYDYDPVSSKAVYAALQNVPSNDTITALEARIAALEANGSTVQETRPRAILVYFVDTVSNNIVPYPQEALEQINDAVRTYPMPDNNGQQYYYSAAIPTGVAILVIAYSRDAWTDNDFGLFGWGPFVERYSGPTADILCTARFFEIY